MQIQFDRCLLLELNMKQPDTSRQKTEAEFYPHSTWRHHRRVSDATPGKQGSPSVSCWDAFAASQ